MALALRVSALCPKNYGVLYRTALVDTPLDAVPPETFSRSRSGKANAEGSLARATVRMNTKACILVTAWISLSRQNTGRLLQTPKRSALSSLVLWTLLKLFLTI